MTLGSRTNDQGKKELLLVLGGDEIKDFEAGKPVVKRSGDVHGDFTVTVVVGRKTPVHADARTGLDRITADGQFIYRGFTIIPDGGCRYTTEQGHAEDTLSELLHALDKHPALADPTHGENLAATRKTTYNGHVIEKVGLRYIVDGNDGTFYDDAVDALHAIDRKEV